MPSPARTASPPTRHAADLAAFDANRDMHVARAAHLHALQAQHRARLLRRPPPGAGQDSSPAARSRCPSPDPRRCRRPARTSGCRRSPCRVPRFAREEEDAVRLDRQRCCISSSYAGGLIAALSTARRVVTGTKRNGTPHDTTCTGRPVPATSSAGSPSAAAAHAAIRHRIVKTSAAAASSRRSSGRRCRQVSATGVGPDAEAEDEPLASPARSRRRAPARTCCRSSDARPSAARRPA